MKRLYLAQVLLLIEADELAQAQDAVSETLRPLCRDFTPESALITWEYDKGPQDREEGIVPVAESLAELTTREEGKNPTYDIPLAGLTRAPE